MRTTITRIFFYFIFLFYAGDVVLCQVSNNFVSSSYLNIGVNHGVHPNYRNEFPEGYYFLEGGTHINLKKIPFKLSFRHSNEDLYTGKSSYFKVSYNPSQKHYGNLADLTKKLKELETQIYELENSSNKELSALSFKNTTNLNTNYKAKYFLKDTLSPIAAEIPDISIDEVSIETTYSKSNSLPKSDYSKLTMLKGEYESTMQTYVEEAKKYQNPEFYSIKKLDIGLTTLPESSISGNAIPIHGLSVALQRQKYFSVFSSGFTMCNQLFSNQLFDQIIYNNYNPFNQNDFFYVDKIKWISSAIVGVGDQRGDFIQIETYHVGNTLTPKFKRLDQTGSITNNFVFQKRLNEWYFKGGTGFSQGIDSMNRNAFGLSTLLYFGELKYIKNNGKIRSEISYRKMPMEYDSWAIGINTRSNEKIQFRHFQKITRKWFLTLRGSIDSFVLPGKDTIGNFLSTRQAGLDQQIKVRKNLQVYSNYTLLMIAKTNEDHQFNHLIKTGIIYTKNRKNDNWITGFDFNYALMNMQDTLGELMQVSNRILYSRGKWTFGSAISWSYNTAIGNFTGQNWVWKPSVKYEKGTFFLAGSIARLWSEQFGTKTGGEIKSGYWFDEYVGFDVSVNYFLPTDFILDYLNETHVDSSPFLVRFKLKIKIS